MEENSNDIPGGTCRICLWPKEWLLSIYDGTFEDLPYKEIYHEIIGEPLRTYRSHPLRICQRCETDMLHAYKFRKRCFEAEEKLQRMEEAQERKDFMLMNMKQEMDVEETSIQFDEERDQEGIATQQEGSLRITRVMNGYGIQYEEDSRDFPGGMCRICVKSEKQLLSMNDGVFEGMSYKEIYEECIGLPLTSYSRNHPPLICQPCETDMLHAYKFRKRCLEADYKLAQEMDVPFQYPNELLVEMKQEHMDEEYFWQGHDNGEEEDEKFPLQYFEGNPETAFRGFREMDGSNEQLGGTAFNHENIEESITFDDTEIDELSALIGNSIASPTNLPDRMCRICLNPHEKLLSLHDGEHEGRSYVEIYEEVIRKPLKDYKSHPPLICHPCLTDMLKSFEFRKRCLEAEEKLMNMEEKFNIEVPTSKRKNVAVKRTRRVTRLQQREAEARLQQAEKVKEPKVEESSPPTRRITRRFSMRPAEIEAHQQRESFAIPLVPRIVLNKLDKPTQNSKPQKQERKSIDEGTPSTSRRYPTRVVPPPPPPAPPAPPAQATAATKKHEYKCNLCPKTFKSTDGYEYHRLNIHEPSPLADCPECGKAVKQSIMRWHVRRHGPVERKTSRPSKPISPISPGVKYQCPDCPKSFKSQNGVEYHKLTAHVKTKKVECTICGKKVKETILRWHLRWHEIQP